LGLNGRILASILTVYISIIDMIVPGITITWTFGLVKKIILGSSLGLAYLDISSCA
jgi:hypothetical protein